MRAAVLSLFLVVAVLVPKLGNAQAFSRPTPPPIVDAASSPWQILGEPIFHAGHFYYPAGPVVFFDGNVMVRTGNYDGIPLYADTTMDPYSIVYVPIGGNLMKPYERRREGELAGTVGSRTPSFPVERNPDVITVPQIALAGAPPPAATGTIGTVPLTALAESPVATRYEPLTIQSIPGPTTNAGVYISYGDERWYLAGPAVPYDPSTFTPIGSYRGFPVYRETRSPSRAVIYVSVIQDGPVAPYIRKDVQK
jgi:hypothetical protein